MLVFRASMAQLPAVFKFIDYIRLNICYSKFYYARHKNAGVFPEFHAFVSYKCMKTIAKYAAPTSLFIIKVAVEKGAQELKRRKRLYFQMIGSCTHFLSLYRFPDLTSVATLNTYPGSVRTWVPFKMKRIVVRLCMASIFLATETAGMSVFNHHSGRLVFLLVKGMIRDILNL